MRVMPIVLLLGVRHWAPFVGFFGGCTLAGYLSSRLSRTGSQRLALVTLALSTLSCVATTGMYGPLIVFPQVVVTNTLVYFFVLSRRWLPHGVAIGLIAVAAPFLLELAGVTTSYRPTENGLLIVERGVALGRTSVLLFGLATCAFGLIAGAVAAAFYRSKLAGTERQLFLRDWHLRQMVGAPEQAHAQVLETVHSG